MKRFILTILASLTLLAAAAENNPYRSDVVWVTVPDKADWIYRSGERANIEIQLLRYGIPQDVVVEYEVGDDMMPSDEKGSVVLKHGRGTVALKAVKRACFRDCRLKAVIDGVTYRHHCKVGFSPEELKPYTPMPEDFDSFWNAAKEELRRVPLTYEITRMDELSTESADCHLVRLPVTRRGQVLYGYLFVPKGAVKGSCPVMMIPPGAGVKTIKNPLRHAFCADEGIIRFEIEIHGLDPRIDDKTFGEISAAFNGRENGYLTNGLDNRDNYYMKRVYMGCVRAVDFLCSLPEWDGRNVIVQGGSQGGALALVTAALDSRVTACVANHPALSDMAGYKAGRAGGYPHFFRIEGMDTPEKIATMAYYDVVNFARRITAPVRMTWGFNDDTCPPTTSYIVYNTLECPKSALITPINEHWTSDATERDHLRWVVGNLITE